MSKDENPSTLTVNEEAEEIASMIVDMEKKESVDGEALAKLERELAKVSEPTQKALLDLPIMQKIIERAAAQTAGKGVPGELMGKGGTQFKRPWTRNDVLEKFPIETWVPERHWDTVTFNGVSFGPFEEGIEYKVPSCVTSIIRDAQKKQRAVRDLEARGFASGVKWLQTGWPGKEQADKSGEPNKE